MPDGKTTAPVPQQQKQLLEHAETVEQILARDHDIKELEEAVADLLEHYDTIKDSVLKVGTGLSALIREKVTAALGHESMEFIAAERRKAFEIIAGTEAGKEVVPLVTKIFGKEYEFPEDDPRRATKILRGLLRDAVSASAIEDEDINAIGDIAEVLLEKYNETDYPKDHGIIDGLIKNIYESAQQRQSELLEGVAQPPADAKPSKHKRMARMSDEDKQKIDKQLEEMQRGVEPLPKRIKRPSKPAPAAAPAEPAPTEPIAPAPIPAPAEPPVEPDKREDELTSAVSAIWEELNGGTAIEWMMSKDKLNAAKERIYDILKSGEANTKASVEYLMYLLKKIEEELSLAAKVDEKIDDLERAAKKDKGLRKDLNVLKILDEFRALSPKEVGEKAEAFGLDWPPEYCEKINKLAKDHISLREGIAQKQSLNAPLEQLKKTLEDVANSRRDEITTSNLDQDFIKYLQKKAGMAPVETPKTDKGTPKDAKTTEPPIEYYEPEAREMPKSIPIAIRKNPALHPVANVNIFIKAWEIYKGAENDLDPKELNVLKTNLATLEKTAERDDEESRLLISEGINDILKKFGDALREAPKPKEKPEDKEMRFLLDHILDDPDYSAKLKKIFDFNSLKADSIENEKEKYETGKIQQEISLVVYSEIMSLYDINKGKDTNKIQALKNKRLTEQRKPDVTTKVKEKIDSLFSMIGIFEIKRTDRKKKEKEEAQRKRMEEEEAENEEVIIPPPPPAKESGEAVGPSPAEKEEPIPTKPKPGAKKTEGEPGAAATGEAAEEQPKPEAVEKSAEGLDKTIQDLMAEILVDKALYKVTGRPKDKASLAIRVLINSELKKEAGKKDEEKTGFSLFGLKGFLLKPNLTLTAAVNKHIGKGLTQLQLELKEADREIKNINDNISTQKSRLGGGYSRKTAGDEETILGDIKTMQGDLRKKEDEKEAINNAIFFKNGTMRYNSTEQVLAMINVYLKMKLGQEKVAEADFLKDVQKQVDAQTRSAHGAGGKWVNVAFGVLTGGGIFKPGLKSTLKNLEKDQLLKKIGAEKFGELAKFWDSRGNVEAWVQGLEGGTDHVMTALVPRIIAYLEMAIKDGNMTYVGLGSGYKAKGLVEHLTAVRHNHILDKVEKNSQGLSDVDRMAMYFKELDKVTVSRNKLTRKLIGRRAGLRALLTGGAIGAGALTLALGGILGIAGLTAGAATVGLGRAAAKAKTPEQKAMYRKLAVRLGLASGIGIAGAAVSPLLIPLAAAGALAPEIWKGKTGIAKGVGKGGKFVGRGAWWGVKAFLAVGLTGGLALFTKWGRHTVFGGLKNVFVPGASNA